MTKQAHPLISAILLMLGLLPACFGQDAPAFNLPTLLTNHELRLNLVAAKGASYRIEASTNLGAWQSVISLTNTTGGVEHVDTAAPWLLQRSYRAQRLDGPTLTGDYQPTSEGDLLIHPVFHATMVLTWKDLTICIDPTTDPRLSGMPSADLILVTHEHSDHYDAAAITSIARTNATLLVSKAVYPLLPSKLKTLATLMTNGTALDYRGISIQAIPAYNSNHPKGNGNGYILTLGGIKLYVSGDTDDIPEMRALRNIDIAFVCMDNQFNMGMPKAASAVREFRPKVVFPYHYNTQNTATFKQLVGTDLGIEVRLRKWQ